MPATFAPDPPFADDLNHPWFGRGNLYLYDGYKISQTLLMARIAGMDPESRHNLLRRPEPRCTHEMSIARGPHCPSPEYIQRLRNEGKHRVIEHKDYVTIETVPPILYSPSICR